MKRKKIYKKGVVIFLSVILATVCCSCKDSKKTETSNDEEIQNQNMQEETVQIDYAEYVGNWVGEEASMEITSSNPEVLSLFFSFPNESGTRVASIEQSILVSSIENNSVTVAFTDSWGSSGMSVLTFGEDSITYELKNVVYGGGLWSVSEGVYNFKRDDSPEEEWQPANPYESTPTYDMSKASGILASKGMTEEEFRASCQPLTEYDHGCTWLGQLHDYPSQYIGQHYVICFQNSTTKMYDVTNRRVISKGVSNDGYTTYKLNSVNNKMKIHIFDLRDDVYSPTISQDDFITPYMIFNGVQTINGIDYICFSMISVDKI